MKTLTVSLLLSALSFVGCQSSDSLVEKKPQNTNRDDNSKTIRLASVNTPGYSGLLDELLEDFEKETGYEVEIYSGSQIFKQAQQGYADLVIAHYGKGKGKGGFKKNVNSGLLDWPKMVFSNQAVLIGPMDDPANASKAKNIANALDAIADSKSLFLQNNIHGLNYLNNISWSLTKQQSAPRDQAWYINQPEIEKTKAAQMANTKQAYFLWGANPFLKWKDIQTQSGNTVNLKIIHTQNPKTPIPGIRKKVVIINS